MKDRIKAVRIAHKLSQEAFGEKLGITGAAVSRIESGERRITDQVILAIVSGFGIDAEWLKTGKGQMFPPRSRDEEVAAFIGDLFSGPPDFRQRLITVLTKLSTEEWKLLETVADRLLEQQNKEADQD